MDLTKTPGYVAGFPLELNLRELGGLPTTDGRHVRHGLFYRGGTLRDLTPEQVALVDGFGLRYLLDLRAEYEASQQPDYVPATAEYQRMGGMRFNDGTEVDFSPAGIERLQAEDPDAFESGLMERLYRGMLFDNPATHALVEHVAAGAVPMYFHCSAGKDRTGMSALLVGLILGVTRAALTEDYLLTNEYRAGIILNVEQFMPEGYAPEDVEMWKKANGVDVDLFNAVYDEIEDRHGTVEAYLEAEFGLDAAQLAELRDRYLE